MGPRRVLGSYAGRQRSGARGAYGRLVLAGEYTAGSQAALMEGALASGIRAAAQLTER